MKKDKPYRPLAPFARAFKAMREAHGLSQSQIAKLAGCDNSFVCAVENSMKPPFPFKMLKGIMRGIAGITPEEVRILSETARDENPKHYPLPCDVLIYLQDDEEALKALIATIYDNA